MIPQIGALLFEIARLNAQIEHDCGDGNPDIQLPFVYEFDPRNMAALSKFSISIEPDEANNKVRFILSEAAHQQPVPGEALILSPETRAAIAADVMKK